MKTLHEIREAVRNKQPLIHCITNPISINQNHRLSRWFALCL